MRRTIAVLLMFLLISRPTIGLEATPTKPVSDELFRPYLIIESEVAVTPVPIIIDPDRKPVPTKPPIVVPQPKPITVDIKPKIVSTAGFIADSKVSWYGPGFYGKRTACGKAYTKTILGVAHKTLKCGTLVTFRYKGKQVTVPVIDRGPYVAGRQWDLSGGLCVYLHHCFTGPIQYRIER